MQFDLRCRVLVADANKESFFLHRLSASERFGRNGHGEKSILVGMYYEVVAYSLKCLSE